MSPACGRWWMVRSTSCLSLLLWITLVAQAADIEASAVAARAALRLAETRLALGDQRGARLARSRAYDQAKVSREAALIAVAANELGRSQLACGDLKLAAHLFDEAARLPELGAAVELNRAHLELILGRLDLAEKHYRLAREKGASPGDDLLNRALLAQRRGQLGNARKLYEEALSSGDERALVNLAGTLVQLGEYEQARAFLERAHSLPARLGLAQLSLRLGDPEGSLRSLRETMRTAGELPLEWRRALWLQRAVAHRALGEQAEARKALQAALEGPPGAGLARVRYQLAEVDVPARAEHEAALAALLEQAPDPELEIWLALSRGQRAGGEAGRTTLLRGLARASGSPELVWRLRFALARLERAEGRGDEALGHYRQALDALDRVRGTLATEELVGSFEADKQPLYREVLALLLERGDVEGAFVVSERARARAWSELLRARGLESPTPGAITSAVVRAVLAPDQTVLSYNVGAERTYLFVLTAGGLQVHTLGVPASLLQQAVGDASSAGALRPASQATQAHFPTELARRLDEALLAPARSELRARLCVVPDGPLYYLPFCLLRTPRGFLLEEHSLTYSSSVSSLLARPVGGVLSSALVYAEPSVPTQSTEPNAQRFGRLAPLPGAAQEARAIARIIPQTRVRRGAECTDAAFRSDVKEQRYDILHFATHGLLDELNPLASGLLMSGSPDILSARELCTLDLRSRLAVLSACQTGLGRVVGGLGMVGLVRAFQKAGVEQVLATQWSISDASTPEILEGFYQALRQSPSPAAALREAQLAALRRGLPPYAWGSFVVYGAE